ncbi:MAG: DUF2079 domain-containing protein [Verrucomicrobiota bacterium]
MAPESGEKLDKGEQANNFSSAILAKLMYLPAISTSTIETGPQVDSGQAPPAKEEHRLWDKAAIFMTLVYILVFSWLSIARHDGLRTQMNDLGNMVQAIWGASQGDLTMRVTNDPDGEIRSRLGVHANVIFYAFALPFAIFPPLVDHMEYVLLVFTSAACGLGGLGIYHYAKHYLPNGRGYPFWIAMAYWINPIVHDANLYDFHITTFISTFIIWMLWAWATGRSKTGWILFTLALLCKEDVAPLLLVLGIGQFVAGNRKTGVKMMLVSTIYLLLLFGILIPLTNFGNPVPKVASSRLDWLGDTPMDYVHTIVTDPLTVLKHVCAWERIRLPFYLLLLGGTLGVFGGSHIMMAVLPTVGISLLAKGDWMTRVTGTYYWIPVMSLIYLACIISLAHHSQSSFQRRSVTYLVVVSAIACCMFSQTPAGCYASFKDYHINLNQQRTMAEVKRLIPPEAAVSAQNNIAAQLAKRRMVAIYPSQSEAADFIIFNLRYPPGPDPVIFPSYSQRHFIRMAPSNYLAAVQGYVQSPAWSLALNENGILLFKRSPEGTSSEISMSFETELFWKSQETPEVIHTRRKLYRLLGYKLTL